MVSMSPQQTADETIVTATFRNKETVTVTGNITADLGGHSSTSDTLTFPPGEDVTVEIHIPWVGSYDSVMQLMNHLDVYATADPITCPYCNGKGVLSGTDTCPDCDGTGKITCPDCEGTGRVDANALISGEEGESGLDATSITYAAVIAVAAVGIAVALFFVLKKRRISENLCIFCGYAIINMHVVRFLRLFVYTQPTL